MSVVWDEVSDSTESKIPRDGWGRPLVVPPTGGKPRAYTRVTTYAGALENMYGLGLWQQRMVALGLARRKDLLLAVAAHEGDKDELNRIAEAAKEAAGASAAATIGTALHKLAERYDQGELALADVPESHRADLEAYRVAMAPLKIHGIEEFVVLDDIKVAGTFDRIVEYDGQRYVADIKTGTMEFGAGKMAIQLALYAHGASYRLEDKTGRGSLDVSQAFGIIIHLPAEQGRCDLYWIDLTAGWDAAALCQKVRAWQSRRNLLKAASFGDVLLAEPEQASAVALLIEEMDAVVITLEEQIVTAPTVAALEALWSANRAGWTDGHTEAARERKAALSRRHQPLRDFVASATGK